MKARITIASAAVSLIFACAGFAPASAQEIPEMTLHFGHIETQGAVYNDAIDRYAKAIEDRSGGKVKVIVAGGGTTGNLESLIEGLQLGTNDIFMNEAGNLATYDPLAGIPSFPFMFRNVDHFRHVYDGPVGHALFDEIEARTGFKVIGAGYRGARELSCNCLVHTPDDLSGVKLRVPPQKLMLRTWETLGANAVPISAVEIYNSLAQGVVDGQENPIEGIYAAKLFEHQKYIMLTNHVMAPFSFLFDSKRFHAWPEALQKILIEEGEAAMLWGSETVIEREKIAREKMEEAGVQFIDVDAEAFRKKLAPLQDEFPIFKDWIAKIEAVQ